MKKNSFNTENQLDVYRQRSSDANQSAAPFGANRTADIAYRKAERLAIATHLITNGVAADEPARAAVRTAVQELLTHTLRLRKGVRFAAGAAVYDVVAATRLIMSLIDVLHAAGWVSDMNADVVKYAYADFAHFLVGASDGVHTDPVELPRDYFAAPLTDTHGHISKGQNNNVKDTSVTDTKKDTKNIKDTKTDSDSVKKGTNTSVRTRRRSDNRRMRILDVISKKKQVHVKDIAREVTGVSEKTIQRELAALVADGVVTKEGEKRWTTYALAL